MRRFLVAFCAQLLRIFFRRIEVVGEHHVPREGAVVFTANHPNGLLDPLLLLCKSPRRVSFLAKEPLFRTPIIGFFVRRFESLPVYRKQDGADPAQNRALLRAAVALLERGNALGLFPEGVSHSAPDLMPFRSGAARMALAAQALGRGQAYLVPAFLYYEQKQSFRSRAVLAFGPPLVVPQVELDTDGEPPRDVVTEITARLRRAISAIAPTAETVDALVLAERAERILEVVTVAADGAGPTLAQRMAHRRRLLDAYPDAFAAQPARVDALIERLNTLAVAFESYGLPIDACEPGRNSRHTIWMGQITRLLLLALPGVLGAAIHTPAYQLVRLLAERYSGKETDVLATIKVLGGLVLFPLTWLVAASCAAALGGPIAFALALVLGPATGWAALAFAELAGKIERQHGQSGSRAKTAYPELAEQRRRLALDIKALLDDQQSPGASPSPPV